MLDEIGKQNFLNHIHNLYIFPELERRKQNQPLPDSFEIRQCLIRLPKDSKPIVEFNNEFGWEVRPKLAPGIELEIGRSVLNSEIADIGEVLPPRVNGERVAFIFLFWNGFEYAAVFDFSPTWSDFDPDDEFELGKVIADYIKRRLVEVAVTLSRNAQQQLRQIGLWPVTTLLPYPISRIVECVGSGHPQEARLILVEHCDGEFLTDLVGTWTPIKVFGQRMKAFHEALWAHKSQYYHASIYTLIPQIEGVITDWLLTVLPSEELRWKPESKIIQFRDLIRSIPQFQFAYREAFESMCEFLLEGPALQVFKKWLDKIDPSFSGRHPVAHGRYEEEIFNEENSIKLFLLLDTICQFMMFYEVRTGKLSTGDS